MKFSCTHSLRCCSTFSCASSASALCTNRAASTTVGGACFAAELVAGAVVLQAVTRSRQQTIDSRQQEMPANGLLSAVRCLLSESSSEPSLCIIPPNDRLLRAVQNRNGTIPIPRGPVPRRIINGPKEISG